MPRKEFLIPGGGTFSVEHEGKETDKDARIQVVEFNLPRDRSVPFTQRVKLYGWGGNAYAEVTKIHLKFGSKTHSTEFINTHQAGEPEFHAAVEDVARHARTALAKQPLLDAVSNHLKTLYATTSERRRV